MLTYLFRGICQIGNARIIGSSVYAYYPAKFKFELARYELAQLLDPS